jgi:DNA-binding transcriptional ArsR family regulator
VSQHLKVLKDAGLVRERSEGARRFYSIDTDSLADVRAYFEDFWDRALASFKEQAERR